MFRKVTETEEVGVLYKEFTVTANEPRVAKAPVRIANYMKKDAKFMIVSCIFYG